MAAIEQEEYITLLIDSGVVKTISPKTPQTDSAGAAGRGVGIEVALNKMAEYGYQLVPGIVIPWNSQIHTIVMRRIK